MDETAIRDFIDQLEDARGFETSTTAIDGWPPAPVRAHDGPIAWHGSVLARATAYYERWPTDAAWPAAVIETAERGRLYGCEPCEEVDWFLERLAREASMAMRPWLFVLVPGRVIDHGDEPFQTGVWYSEARGRGAVWQNHGDAILSPGGITLEAHDDGCVADSAFTRILRGHPDRRRHPLRRR